MKNLLLVSLALAFVIAALSQVALANTMAVRWIKPASDKVVCGIQEEQMTKAVKELTHSLHGKNIDVQFGYVSFPKEKPSGDAASAVGLWINGKPFEYWLHAESANNSDCVETKVDGQSYRTIPSELIVKAGLTAAEMMSNPVPREHPKQAAVGR